MSLMCRSLFSAFLFVTTATAAAPIPLHPYPGVTCRLETREEPPQRIFVAEVDLTNPKVHVRVAPGGADPDGAGEWETTLMRPTRIAEREQFDLTVNGDFFLAKNVKDAEGAQSQYRSEIWAAASGPAMSEGRPWSTPRKKVPCLIAYRSGRVSIELIERPPADAREIVAGNTLLVEDGKPVVRENKTRHPRTVVGLDASGEKLMILVIDGRKPGVAVGMSYAELSQELIKRGCRIALNLDGGGSSAMVLRDAATNEYKVLNDPSDGHERAVANVLGISIGEKPDKPVVKPEKETGSVKAASKPTKKSSASQPRSTRKARPRPKK